MSLDNDVKVEVNRTRKIPNRPTRATRYRSTDMSTTFSITGNVVRDVELRKTNNGKAVGELAVAYNALRPDGTKGDTSFYNITMWEYLAVNVAASVKKGDRVVVTGRMRQESWEDADTGKNRTKTGFVANDVALSLLYATGEAVRTQKHVDQEASAPAEEAAVVDADGNDIFA